MKMWRAIAIAAGAAALLVVGAAGQEEPAPAEHMEVDGSETCAGCHRELTPRVVEEWTASRHGLNNVKCFVCHGAADETFRLRPQPRRCQGCHPGQVESFETPAMAGKDCFSCHPPHLLSPHRAAGGKEPGGEP